MSGRGAETARVLALCITNVIKLGGLYIALRAASRALPDPITIGLAAFMMAGAQVSEDTIMNLVTRMFGSRDKEDHS